jgi:hypothetical protein
MDKRGVCKGKYLLLTLLVLFILVFCVGINAQSREVDSESGSNFFQSLLNGLINFFNSLIGAPSITGYFAAGDGSAGNPYQISDCIQLQSLNSYTGWTYQDTYFVLVDDIMCGGGFDPIGDSSNSFYGHFDGQGHTISNVGISGGSYIGLFTRTDGAEIKNFNLENIQVTCSDYCGAVAGFTNQYGGPTIIENVGVTGTVNGGQRVGGLVGYIASTQISGSYSAVDVSGSWYVGGLVGYTGGTNSALTDCYANGTVSATGGYVGGLIGQDYDTSVTNCYATGGVTGSGSYVAGLIGYLYANPGRVITVENSFATGSVSGSSPVAGLVAYARALDEVIGAGCTGDPGCENCNSDPDPEMCCMEREMQGDMCWWESSQQGSNVNIHNDWFYDPSLPCVATTSGPVNIDGGSTTCMGNVAPSTFHTITNQPMGGGNWDFTTPIWSDVNNGNDYPPLAWQVTAAPPPPPPWASGDGSPGDPFQITNNCSELQAIGSSPEYLEDYFVLVDDVDCTGFDFEPIADAMMGEQFTGGLDGAGYTVTGLTINRPTGMMVGLFGMMVGGSVTDLDLVDVNVTGMMQVGALAGMVDDSYDYGDIDNVYVSGTVSADMDMVGGLFGMASGEDISNCDVDVTVSGMNQIGGLIGYLGESSVYNSSAVGDVSGYGYVGGLVGYNSVSDIDNSYAGGTVLGAAMGVGGLVGMLGDDSAITASFATGTVTGTGSGGSGYGVGGLIGYAYGYDNIDNCYANGTVISSDARVGGLVGVEGPTININH